MRVRWQMCLAILVFLRLRQWLLSKEYKTLGVQVLLFYKNTPFGRRASQIARVGTPQADLPTNSLLYLTRADVCNSRCVQCHRRDMIRYGRTEAEPQHKSCWYGGRLKTSRERCLWPTTSVTTTTMSAQSKTRNGGVCYLPVFGNCYCGKQCPCAQWLEQPPAGPLLFLLSAMNIWMQVSVICQSLFNSCKWQSD